MPKRMLSNATISHVSYVNKAANKKKFFLTKSEEPENLTFEKEVRIIKGEDEAQKLVYGVVYEPDVPDAHGDAMTAEEIEKAAHKYLKDYRGVDKQHNFTDGAGELVESYVAPTDMTVNGETITKGSWVIVTKATDEIWEAIEKGEITGYSMGGVAEVEEIQKQESLMDKIVKALAPIVKGELKDNFDATKKQRDFRTAFSMFENIWWTELWKENGELDVDRMREAANDFIDVLQTVANEPNLFKALGGKEGIEELREMRDLAPVQKAQSKANAARIEKLKAAQAAIDEVLADTEEVQKTFEEEPQMTKEEMQEVLKTALSPVVERIEKLEGEKPEEEVKKEEGQEEVLTADVVKSLFQEALQPIEKRLETVEKARGIQKAETVVEEDIVKEDEKPVDNFWKGVL